MSAQPHPKLPAKPGMGTYELMTYSQVTTSTADRKYSFGRQSRFPKLNCQGTDVLSYDSPSTISKRGTNLGVGARFKANRYLLESKYSSLGPIYLGDLSCFVDLILIFILFIERPSPDSY